MKDNSKEGYYINGYDSLTAKEIENISQFNVNGMIGASAGIGAFKIMAQYIYRALNILDKLNDKNLNVGNQSMFVFTAMVSF